MKLLELQVLLELLHETLPEKVALHDGTSVLDKAREGFPSWIRVILPLHFELNLLFVLDACDTMANDTLNVVPAAIPRLLWSLWLFHWKHRLIYVTQALRVLCFTLHATLSDGLVQIRRLLWPLLAILRRLLDCGFALRAILGCFLLTGALFLAYKFLALRPCGFSQFRLLAKLVLVARLLLEALLRCLHR